MPLRGCEIPAERVELALGLPRGHDPPSWPLRRPPERAPQAAGRETINYPAGTPCALLGEAEGQDGRYSDRYGSGGPAPTRLHAAGGADREHHLVASYQSFRYGQAYRLIPAPLVSPSSNWAFTTGNWASTTGWRWPGGRHR